MTYRRLHLQTLPAAASVLARHVSHSVDRLLINTHHPTLHNINLPSPTFLQTSPTKATPYHFKTTTRLQPFSNNQIVSLFHQRPYCIINQTTTGVYHFSDNNHVVSAIKTPLLKQRSDCIINKQLPDYIYISFLHQRPDCITLKQR